ncbi:MAG: phosphatase PAP2 family protein [Rhodospirillales bacterium]|nr:phosphatase PAP2 family protein [Rhodospirillales bacterium]MDE1882730.1 phosphatase PAP2 family protein [Rhodospirillales bacterium]MDE2390669.1 phosphatase PAP2 family protein [Rhodospirillales bacterium]MDE2458266.1 phosphatase PAP2 family protein [Rhodospirillales bacterium]
MARPHAGKAPLLYGATAGALAASCVLCILFVDKPVAAFWQQHQELRPLFQAAAAPSLLALPTAGLILLYALLRRLRGQTLPDRLWLTLALATVTATAAKDELKWIFGRAWPGTWLQYGVYGFHPFIESILYGAFPSGHTSYAAAPLGVLWIMRPRWRPVAGAIVLLVMAGLVCADYHFVSDVLGGLLTGGVCAWAAVRLMEPRRG